MADEKNEESKHKYKPPINRLWLFLIVAALGGAGLISVYLWGYDRGARSTEISAVSKDEYSDVMGGNNEVELSPEALAATEIEYVAATERPAIRLLRVTGTVEANQQQMQEVTPLVAGRIERVNVALGDRVRVGAPLAVISSPQVAEMHGKLREAETRLQSAERNLVRVQKSENRVAVLSAKARLDEAEAALKRMQRLIQLGAGAGKDLIAAETAYKTAKAEYEFQSNISLNKELAEAHAEVDTARVDVQHTRDGLSALGAPVPEGSRDPLRKNISLVTLRSPVSGTVIERTVNVGAGVEIGKPLFTVANISTLWIIANVPEAQVGNLRVGALAEAHSAALGEDVVAGRVTYIDPVLNTDTRAARVRIEIKNPQERLKVGMFVEVGFQTGTGRQEEPIENELVISEEAVQRFNERTVVFLPKEGEMGHFEARDVELGGSAGGYLRVISGLKPGERIVSKGSFTLKTQLLKGAMGDQGH